MKPTGGVSGNKDGQEDRRCNTGFELERLGFSVHRVMVVL